MVKIATLSIITIAFIFLIPFSIDDVFAEVPDWVKNNAEWWADGKINDTDFLTGIEFLIKEGTIVTSSNAKTTHNSSDKIPDWVKNNAKWWADGTILDDDFLNSLEYLINQGIINVSTEPLIEPLIEQGDYFTTGYLTPSNSNYESHYSLLKENQILETFVNKVNEIYVIPENISVVAIECDTINAFYDPNKKQITVCYELIDYLSKVFQATSSSEQEFVNDFTGTLAFIMLHELGHALVDVYDIPITGMEEDAVDQLSVLLILSIEDRNAYSYLASTASWFFLQGSSDITSGNMPFWDEHSLNIQRYYNILCLSYGSNPTFGSGLVEEGLLPAERAVRCLDEFDRMSTSWKQLLEPHLQDVKSNPSSGGSTSTYDNYFPPRVWQTSGPFSIDRIEYSLGETIFLRIDELSSSEKGEIRFLRPFDADNYQVYLTIPFDGSLNENRNWYLSPELRQENICNKNDLVGEWAVQFQGTNYRTMHFEITDNILSGEEHKYRSVC